MSTDGAETAPLISVIIPVYNAERYVGQAVASVLQQLEPVEVILVEDGSTDGSLALCRGLAERHAQVKLIGHPGGRNLGAGASRNAGIRHARGDYVAFLDADDYYLPGRFATDMEILGASPDVDGVYGCVENRFQDGADDPAAPGRITMDGGVPPEGLFSALLDGTHGWFCTDAITVRRRVFEKAGLFDERLRLGQDAAMWLKMAATCRLVAGSVERPVAVYRRYEGNRSGPANADWRDAGCACLASVLAWAGSGRLSATRVTQLRQALLWRVFQDRLDGLSWRSCVLQVARRLAHYVCLRPALVAELLRMVTRRLQGERAANAFADPPPEDLTAAADVPLISVVIPVYNAEPMVEHAVQSALDAHADLEVLLVEDGSEDESLAACRRAVRASHRVRLLRHDEGANRGPGASRNLGIRAARGRYVAFLDADDYYLPSRFDVDVAALEASSDVDGVYGAVATLFEAGSAQSDTCSDLTTTTEPIPPGALFIALLSNAHGRFCVDGITVRREVFDRTGPFDEHLAQAEDTAMWLKMAAVCTLAAGSIDEPIAVRRRYGGNLSVPGNATWREAGCACMWTVLKWVRVRPELRHMVKPMRYALAVGIVSRLEGLPLHARAALAGRRALSYGLRYPLVLPDLARVVARKLLRRSIAGHYDRWLPREGGGVP